MAWGYSAKLPLSRDLDDGYSLTKTLEQVATQNLIHLLLTNPGERIMDPEFGVGLKRYLFEMNTQEIDIDMQSKINSQVSKYLSYLKIQNIQFQRSETNENLINLKIIYSILPTGELFSTDLAVSNS